MRGEAEECETMRGEAEECETMRGDAEQKTHQSPLEGGSGDIMARCFTQERLLRM